MTDVHNKKTRSFNMSQIKGKNTKPELLVRKFLHAQGFRYTLHNKKLPGKPDIVLPKYKTIVFIHGYFWHGHKNCKYFVVPKTRTKWWVDKINLLREADMQKIQNLGKREATSGLLLLQQLFITPILTAASVAAHTGFSRLGAQKVIDRFVAKEILKPKDKTVKYGKTYIYRKYVSLFGG